MTYLIGDRTVSLNGYTISTEDEQLLRANPHAIKLCLNVAARKYLLALKKIVHLYADILTIYSTLLLKIVNYDDITSMTYKTKLAMVRLEDDVNAIFGRSVEPPVDGWEAQPYEGLVKTLGALVIDAATESFSATYRTLNCMELFFLAFDNLKKLLIPNLLVYTPIVQRSLACAHFLFGLLTVANNVARYHEMTPATVRQILKIDSITSGFEREAKGLGAIYTILNTSLAQYTSILLGRAILKREIVASECQIIRRREVCFQAAEHVVSIPLSGESTKQLYVQLFEKHLFYFFSAMFLVMVLVVYRLYTIFF